MTYHNHLVARLADLAARQPANALPPQRCGPNFFGTASQSLQHAAVFLARAAARDAVGETMLASWERNHARIALDNAEYFQYREMDAVHRAFTDRLVAASRA